MAIIRYRPTASLLESLQKDLNDVFSSGTPAQATSGLMDQNFKNNVWDPRVDIKEETQQYVVLADVPGVDPKNIEVTLDGRTLTIKGEKSLERKDEEKNYSRIERFSGSFIRQFTMPDNIDPDKVSAKGKHGVLEIYIPKIETSISKSIKVVSED